MDILPKSIIVTTANKPNISVSTASPKTVTTSGINVIDVSNLSIKSNSISYTTGLYDGYDYCFVNFPKNFPSIPTVICEMENNVDYFVYSYVISSVSISGFMIHFSDVLTNSGYRLHVRAAL